MNWNQVINIGLATAMKTAVDTNNADLILRTSQEVRDQGLCSTAFPDHLSAGFQVQGQPVAKPKKAKARGPKAVAGKPGPKPNAKVAPKTTSAEKPRNKPGPKPGAKKAKTMTSAPAAKPKAPAASETPAPSSPAPNAKPALVGTGAGNAK